MTGGGEGPRRRGVIVYPPKAYYFMPYLAPYILRAHLEGTGRYEISVADENIAFHRYTFGRTFAEMARHELEEDTGLAVLADLLHERGEASFRALRDAATFTSSDEVSRHADLLREAERLTEAVDGRRRVYRKDTPPAHGKWPRFVENLRSSVAGRFLAERVARGDFDGYEFIGICAAYTPQLPYTALLAKLLKERNPGVLVVVGGGAVTHLLDDLSKDASFFDAIDFAVPYEGEHTLLELLDRHFAGEGPPANVLVRRGERVVYKKSLGSRPKVVVSPDFRGLRHEYPTPEPVYPLLTSKGCYWGKCTFCSHHEGYGQGYSKFPEQFVETSIERLVGAGARYFYFVDEALPPAKLTQFANTFEAMKTSEGERIEIAWMAEARMEKTMATAPVAALLRRSGCRLLVNGIESGAQSVVDRMKKGIDLEKVAEFAKSCRDEGIRTGWMFFVGYPGETDEEARRTFEYIDANRGSVDYASVGVFVLERGAPMWTNLDEAGISEVLNRNEPYAETYDLKMKDGSVVTHEALEARLRRLKREFERSLAPTFRDAADRALTLFFAPKAEMKPRGTETARYTWDSPHFGKRLTLSLRRTPAPPTTEAA